MSAELRGGKSEQNGAASGLMHVRSDFFPMCEYGDHYLFIRRDDGTQWLMAVNEKGVEAAKIGALLGAFLLGPILSVISAGIIATSDSHPLVLAFVLALGSLPTGAFMHFLLVREKIVLKPVQITSSVLLTLSEQSRSKVRINILVATMFLPLVVALIFLVTVMDRTDLVFFVGVGIGIFPLSLYALKGVIARSRWERRWKEVTRER